MHFTPLKHYKRAMIIAVLLPLIVAIILCLHLYRLKLERAYQDRQDAMFVVNGQVEALLDSAQHLFTSIELTVARPLAYVFDNDSSDAVAQYDGYYYQKLDNDLGEVVGLGQRNNKAWSQSYWQSLYTLGPVFSNALILSPALEAIAYVNEVDTVFVKRHNTANSELLTQLLKNEFRPDFIMNPLAGSKVLQSGDSQLFALGTRRKDQINGYFLLVYDLGKLSLWLHRSVLTEGEIRLFNQYDEFLASSTFARADLKPWGNVNQASSATPWKNGIFMERKSNRAINFAYFESEADFKETIFYELMLEVAFLVVFLLLMAISLFWLSLRLFIKPVEQFVGYLVEQNGRGTDPSYRIPSAWQPWFKKIKGVIEQKQLLLKQLSKNNEVLDSKLQQQARALERSLEAKDKQAALLNTMLDSVPDLIYFKNIDGSFLGCNRAFESFFGFTRHHLVGRTHDELTTKYLTLLELERDLLVNNKVIEQKVTFAEKVFEVRVAPFYHEKTVLGTMAVLRDITQLDTMVTALKQSESKFRAAIEYAANGVMLVAIDGTIIELNKAVRRFFGAKYLELGTPLANLFNEYDYPQVAQMLSDLLEDSKKVQHLTIEQQAPVSHLQLSASLVWDAQQRPLYFVLHIQNITALTNARLAAERGTLAKSRFIANISHEIRTPLNAILGLSELIRSANEQQDIDAHADKIKISAKQLLTMLNSILDFAKVESQKSQLYSEPFKLMELVETCHTLTEAQCIGKGLAFHCVIDPKIHPSLKGDIDKLKQVLLNLLSNAVKFTPMGFVTLAFELEKQDEHHQWIRFVVEDSGIGIKSEEQERLFDAFTQGDDSSTRKFDGIGLGLAIVKHEVALMGGEIQLASEVKKGSRFYFSLSLEKARAAFLTSVQMITTSQMLPDYVSTQIKPWLNDLSNIELDEGDWLLLDEFPNLDDVNLLSQQLAERKFNIGAPKCVQKELQTVFKHAAFHTFPLQGFWQSVCDKLCQGELDSARKFNEDVLFGLLVVIVDDNPLNLTIAKNMLSHFGAHAITCQNPCEAFDLICELQPDLVFMDIHMPLLDGFELTKQLRQVFSAVNLPIVALTADTQLQDNSALSAAGMSGIVTKPIEKQRLICEVSKCIVTKEAMFDEQFALEQMMGDANVLTVMLHKFAKLIREQQLKLEKCNDPSEFALLSHNIKGTAAGLGFKRLAAKAKEVELQGKSGELERSDVDVLKARLEQARVFIRWHCGDTND
ncbi:hypothetical protein PALB_2820 [Pseudoalteromonas luteoviolacea B = ATCC 29581]|nr:hypothetical protein PALB_2820 [Pseudoalteromonas luteoviolacea B = ATCC 29581]